MKEKLKKVKKPTQLLKKKKLNVMKKKKIESTSVDEFMSGFLDNVNGVKKTKKKVKSHGKSSEDTANNFTIKKNRFLVEEEENSNCEKESDNESNLENEFVSHKKHLHSLKQSDPEFYKYLEENDQDLLNFDESDTENDEKNEVDALHKPPDALEVASDESDYEPEEVIKKNKDSNRVTKELIQQWQDRLQSKCTTRDLKNVAEAFHAAIVSISQEEDATCIYKVEGGVIFNSVIRMCLIDFFPAVQKILKVNDDIKTHPVKCKNWNRVKPILKLYLSDLSELCTASSPNMLSVLLKHVHQLCTFIVCFPIIATKFMKRMVQLWATDEEVVRVLAFLCALRLANLRTSLLRKALKVMHITYVKNTKFVSLNTLPGINFMRQSLCEMFALDNTISYHAVFLYIRQLAIHLRSAVTLKKKESYKIVYNWAYISSLHLWAELFGIVPNSSPLKTLVYPLVQIIIGTIKLISSSSYYPLRFHCCRILIQIRSKCDVFIPILPFLLEVLRDFNFTREHKKLSLKPIDFTGLLRCSKSQLKENGFKDAVIENIYILLMEYMATECHRISFPDLVIPFIIEVKKFLKTCKYANYAKKMKSVLDKVIENSKFIEAERKKLTLKIEDINSVEAIEAGLNAKQPPFLKYYESWKKIHFQQQARKITNNQTLGDFKLPVLKKLDTKRNKVKVSSSGLPDLFPSDDDTDNEDLFEEVAKDEPPKKRKKVIEEVQIKEEPEDFEDKESEFSDDMDGEDIIQDLTYSDLK